MKLNLILAAAAATILTASCGILGTGVAPTATTTPSVQTGAAAGSALLGLFNQYKTDGKLDLTNVNNIINLATVATNAKGLTGQDLKSALVSNFVNGLVSGSNNLVTKANSTDVLSNLQTISNLNLNKLTNAASNLATNASNAASTIDKINTTSTQVTTAVNAVNNIFSLFKK